MRALPLILVLLLAGCGGGGAPSTPSGLEALLVQVEDGDPQALEPALRAVASDRGNTEARDRLRAALVGLPLRRAQVAALVAPLEPDWARELTAARSIRLAVTADEEPLAQTVAQAVARGDDWIQPVPSSDRSATVARLRRLPPGDTFEIVLHRGREPVRDTIQRLDCGTDATCTATALAATIATLLSQ